MKISLVVAEIFGRICRFLPSHPKSAVVTVTISGVTGPNVTKIVHSVEKLILFNILKSELRYWRLVHEKRRFFNSNWLPWQRPLRNQKKLNEVNKPFPPSTNPEILVKIGQLGSELPGIESRPIKKIKKHWQNI